MNTVSYDVETKFIKISRWKVPFLVGYNKIWNLCRRPLVWAWKREVISIATLLKQALSDELLPIIHNQKYNCRECYFLYNFLKGQPFTSQIEQALLHSSCSQHSADYNAFYMYYEAKFKRSHELADLICGFKSNVK